MPGDGQQSAYQYRSRRHRANYDDDDTSEREGTDFSTKSTPESVNDRSEQESSKLDRNKLMSDAFFGTVAGRLAQEIHDEFLVCKICFESYTNPKCLACLHTFCASCIERHISAEVTYNRYTDYKDFTCPLCRKRTQLPLGGVKRLPDNFLISGLTELVMRQRTSSNSSSSMTLTSTTNLRGPGDGFDADRHSGTLLGEEYDSVQQLPQLARRGATFGECEICSQVGGRDRGRSTEPSTKPTTQADTGQRSSSAHLSNAPQATAKCLDCNKLLCADCVQRHRDTRVTKDHATFDLHSGKDIECKEHPGEPVRFYCDECSACICVLCTFNEHREHEVTSFGEAVASMRATLSSTVEHTQQRMIHCQLRLNAINELADLVQSLERQIRETTGHFIELVQKQEQELLHDLHEFVGIKTMDSIEQQTEQEHQLQLADLICKEANQYLDGQEIDMLLAKAEMYQKLEQLGQLNLDDSEVEPISSEVYFRPGSIQLGYLTNDPSAPSTEHYEYMHMPLSSSQSSIELANRPCVNTTSCQTDPSLLEKYVQSLRVEETKPTRSRACNTEMAATEDKETNTRPRGINTIISFSDVQSTANSEEFLSQLEASKLDFQSMDNLTRARIRRKLREHCNTFDASNGVQDFMNGDSKKPPKGGTTDFVTRRYSSIDKHH
ncbi:Tripartite motif-containing protein 2 [Fasciolopsis buskii]|uniref:Tripartite motif-containing protein 2 n=1 Tax=Fasciolopsis buskii TaxID=27845 RepID=A0A8E0S9K4_9TREM|nr:Tripartite motif-containing protein 2 [Fasciolopsis buski]